jgi:hypothetical protein
MPFKQIDDRLEFDEGIHLFQLDGRPVPSITQCLVSAGLIDTQWFTDYCRDRGSAIHKACHYMDENDLDPDFLDSSLVGFLDAWMLFCQQHNCQWTDIETPVYSVPLQIAGIPDRIGVVDGLPSIVEIKSGLIYPVHGVQLALQARMARPVDLLNRYSVRLKENGNYELHEFKSRDDLKVGLAALTITHFKRRNGK